MEILIHISVSIITLICFVFLLPLPWSLFGKVMIAISSSIIGGLFIVSWKYQSGIQVILLNLALVLSITFLIIKKWENHFSKESKNSRKITVPETQPLFSYHQQIEKAKLAKPAEMVEPDYHIAAIKEIAIKNHEEVLESLEFDLPVQARQEELDKTFGSVTEEELQFLLDEEEINAEQPAPSQNDLLVEDEPGYLFDDWLLPQSSENTAAAHVLEDTENQESALFVDPSPTLNIISFDQKRKAKEKQLEMPKDVADQVAAAEEAWMPSDHYRPEHESLLPAIEHETSFGKEIGIELSETDFAAVDLEYMSQEFESEIDTVEDTAEEDLNVPFISRASLLNDGIANLYKEQAESVRKQKTKEENTNSELINEKQFIKELSNRFRASSE